MKDKEKFIRGCFEDVCSQVEWKCSILQKGDQIALIHGEAFIKIGKEYFDIIDEIIKKQLKLFMDNYGKSCAFR